jgi:hypothetical protein
MGSCALDKIEKDYWPGVLRSWQAESWLSDVYGGIYLHRHWNLERNHFGF